MKRTEEAANLLFDAFRVAAAGCVNALASQIKADTKEAKARSFLALEKECRFFLLHYARRVAFMNCNPDRNVEVWGVLSSRALAHFVNYFFRHWPVEGRRDLSLEMLDALDTSEAEYSTGTELMKPESVNSFSGNSIYEIFCRRAAAACGRPSDPALMQAALSAAAASIPMIGEAVIAACRA